MRWRFVPALLSLALLGSMTRELGGQGRGQDARPGIAVLPFDNSGSYGQDKENFDALQKGIAGMLISELAANPAARVGEREEIEKLRAEQSLGASGKVTPRLCWPSSFSISSRSTTRAAGLAASSEMSIPAMPFCSASKFSLSCPYEPLLSNGSTAMPGRVSWPRPWAPRLRPMEPSSANETNARRRARIESVPRSESQCHAFLRRHDLGGQTLRSRLAAGGREQRVDGLVAVLGLMMEQHQALHARIPRQRHRFLERRVAPSPVLFQLLGCVHRVVDEQLHTPQERHEVLAPRRSGLVVSARPELVVDRKST